MIRAIVLWELLPSLLVNVHFLKVIDHTYVYLAPSHYPTTSFLICISHPCLLSCINCFSSIWSSGQAERNLGFIGPLLSMAPLVPYPDSDEEDDDVNVIPDLPSSVTLCKRRAHVMKETLDDSFLSRYKIFSRDHGFCSDQYAQEAADNPKLYALLALDADVVAPCLSIQTIDGMPWGS